MPLYSRRKFTAASCSGAAARESGVRPQMFLESERVVLCFGVKDNKLSHQMNMLQFGCKRKRCIAVSVFGSDGDIPLRR